MDNNLQNIIDQYKVLAKIKPSSPEEFKNLAIKIQSLSQLLKGYFKDEFTELFHGTEFLINFNEAMEKITDEHCNNFIKKIKKKNYSAEDIVTLLDSNLSPELKILALVICSDIEYYLKLNTYLINID